MEPHVYNDNFLTSRSAELQKNEILKIKNGI